jgi:Type I phosphodiesterase / nucleotide pyrophosphatase
LLLGLVPLLLLICGFRSLLEEDEKATGQQQVYPVQKFRTVVLLLDSVGTPMAFDPTLMPFVSSLTTSSLFGESRACPMKATFPCVKSIFEGRVATTGTNLQNFSAVASKRTTWPGSLARLGKRLVVASDHTINRLYPAAFVDSLNYENLRVPLFERDNYAYRQTEKWMADPSIDALLIHIIGTDKVAHQYPVRGPEYRAKYLEVDDFVRTVAAQLAPNDYLYIIGDHGHNDKGGHTEDAAYIAHGPLFPQGKHQDLDSADMLFLLSVPYGLTLPEEYEGSVRMDLTLLSEELRQEFLHAQAQIWEVPADGLSNDALEARLNEQVIKDREEEHHADAIEIDQRVGPWILAAALFLLSQLRSTTRTPSASHKIDILAVAVFAFGILLGIADFDFGAWLVSAGALYWCVRQLGLARTLAAFCLLALLTALEFWLLPSRAGWFHNIRNQSLGWSIFYPAAALAGIIFSFASGPATLRQRFIQVLWTIGVAIWLLAYFGPYKYALTGRGPLIVLLILAPMAIIVAGGWRTLISGLTLCGIGLLPFIIFHTESHNIEYLVDTPAALPFSSNIALGAAIALIWLYLFRRTRPRPINWVWSIILLTLWYIFGTWLFEFETGKLMGALLGGIWLAGCLELFRRAGLGANWSALVSAIMVFAVFYFALNGFTLSHVDFRFASEKIIPFQQEALRAPQLIAWAMLKYGFILLPVLLVLGVAPGRTELARYLAQFGWWRELMLAICTLGLPLFDKGGLNELCGEEIYFWTFLNLVIWVLALVITGTSCKIDNANEAEIFSAVARHPAGARTSPPPPG